jgi:hypothetical protein
MFNGFFQISTCLLQGLLAVHETNAGFGPQILYLLSRNSHSILPLFFILRLYRALIAFLLRPYRVLIMLS